MQKCASLFNFIRLKEQEEAHLERQREKSKEFERWISQKEKALEEEAEARKAVDNRLEQANVDLVEIKKKLEQVEAKHVGPIKLVSLL